MERVELHLHTGMSAMDGASRVSEYIGASVYEGATAMAITDHASVQAFPEAYQTVTSDNEKLKLIYGVEVNVPYDNNFKSNYFHLTILAKNKTGLKNLYKLVSMANTKYFYKVPRTPKQEIERLREGLLIGSGCDCGELYRAIVEGKSINELTSIANFYDYIEVVPINNFRYYIDNNTIKGEKDLQAINRKIIDIGAKIGKPVVAVSDAHYSLDMEVLCRKILMHHKGFENYETQPDLSMKSTNEMLAEFDYLGSDKAYEIVVENTNLIADMMDQTYSPIELEAKYSADSSELKNLVWEKAQNKYGKNIPNKILERIEWELSAICQNDVSIYNFLIGVQIVNEAIAKGWNVGNRGSVSSSLVAYLLGITFINPLEAHYYCPNCHYIEFHNEFNCGADMEDKICDECGERLTKEGFTIPPETFFGTDPSREIDVDYNFSPMYQKNAMEHLKKIVEGSVVRAGTVGTIPYETAMEMINSYCEDENIDFEDSVKIGIAANIQSVKRRTGMHPGGMFVIPAGKEVYDYTPVQYPADDITADVLTTHFDFHAFRNLLKVDLLSHDDLSMIKRLEELTGLSSKDIPLDDKKTIQLFTSGETCGLSDFSSRYIREYMMSVVKPYSLDDLIRISALSHGSDIWYKNGEELIKKGISIKEIVSCRDDVMLYLINKGIDRQYSFKVSEQIRKGKGLTEEQYSEFVNMGIEKWRLDSWNKIKYAFPRAHAASYVVITYKLAYYKVHFPLEFYCAYFSENADRFDADVLINNSKNLVTEIEKLKLERTSRKESILDMMEVCREMYEKGNSFIAENIKNEGFESFFIEDGKLRPKLCK